jgi:tetratricopeptide (TPR) repeat protein
MTSHDHLTYGESFANALANYGNILMRGVQSDSDDSKRASDSQEAKDTFEEAIAIFRELYKADSVSFGPELADALINATQSISDPEKAIANMTEPLELLESASLRDPLYKESLGRALHDRASLAWMAYKESANTSVQYIERALRDLEAALIIRRELKRPSDMAASLSLQALVYEEMKDYDKARRAAQEGLEWNQKSPLMQQRIQEDMQALLQRIDKK